MSSFMLRACACIAMALIPVVNVRADEAAAAKQIQKMGGFVVTLGGQTSVTLAKINITDNDMNLLLDLKNVTSLTITDNTSLTDAGFIPVGKLKNLNLLQIAVAKISDTGVKEFRGLDNLGQLTIDRTNVKGPGLRELKDLKKLRWLIFTGPNVTNASLKYVAELQTIQQLVLTNNTGVTDEGVKDLKGMNKLTKLSLIGTGVTDKGIQVFQNAADFEKLSDLFVNKTKVTKAGVDELIKARGKKLQVIY